LTNKRAVKLRDEGKIAEARQVLTSNGTWLKGQAALWDSEALSDYGRLNEIGATQLDEANWNRNRKQMRDTQYKNAKQRSY